MVDPPSRRPATRRHVILVRTPKQPRDRDPYHLAHLARLARDPAQHADLQLHHLAILETDFCNQDNLRAAVRALQGPRPPPPTPTWDGVVMTSARSVEAYCAAQRALDNDDNDPSGRPLATPVRTEIPFFVVGHPTCTALQRAPCPPRHDQVLGAEECGTGERLAEYIVQHFAAQGTPPGDPTLAGATAATAATAAAAARRRPRLLYLTGDKNRDTIPRRLARAGIDLDPLQVYSTSPSPAFPSDLDAVLAEIDASSSASASDPDGTSPDAPAPAEVWFALFSPSGAAACLAELRRRALIPAVPNGADASVPGRHDAHLAPRVRFAAIGPVTEHFLRDQALPVHAVAHKPEPSALLDAVSRAEGESELNPAR